MSDSGDDFDADTAKITNTRQLASTDYLQELTGELAETGERVTVFTLAPELTTVDAAVDAFTRVSDTWYNASANANIRSVRERDTEPRPWLAVPDDSGETLASAHSDLTPSALGTVVTEVADALRTLGLYNTVHGHLTPDDIHLPGGADVTDDLPVEVGGFGLEAAISAAIGEYEPTAYTAPELLDGSNQGSQRTDVYGLGAVTYFALTGRPPIESADLDRASRDGPSVPPSAYADAIPTALDDVLMRALSTRPEDRYNSPYSFRRAFLATFDETVFDTPTESTDREDEAGDDSPAPDERSSSDSSPATDTTPSEGSTDAVSDSDEQDEPRNDTGEDTGHAISRRAAFTAVIGLPVVVGWAYEYDSGTVGHLVRSAVQKGPVWSYQTGGDVRSSPAVVDGTVYVGSNDGTVYALTADDGAEQWSHRTDADVRSSPTVADGSVYVGSGDGNVYALSTAEGTEQWTYRTGDAVTSSPAVVDGTVYVGSGDGKVYALDATDGTEQWFYRTENSVASSPVVVDGTVSVGSWDGTVYALDAADGTLQWFYRTGDIVDSSPSVADGAVYVGSMDGHVYALSADDGTEQWSYRMGDYVISSPTVVDGTVYVGGGDGSVYAISTTDGDKRWDSRPGDVEELYPTVGDGTVYAGSGDNNVYALSAADGTKRWSYQTGGDVRSSPVVVDGAVYVGSWDNSVYAFSER